MWVWLTISMLLVIACIIFGIYSFINSRTLQKTIVSEPVFNHTSQLHFSKSSFPVLQQQALAGLKIKLTSIEKNSLQNVYQLNALQKRVEALESNNLFSQQAAAPEHEQYNDEDEDWEKLYYETRREKKALEETLKHTQKILEENLNKDEPEQNNGYADTQFELEEKQNELNNLQAAVEDLTRKLDAARERENELVQELAHEKSRHAGYDLMQKQNNQLRSEIDMLTERLQEVNEQNMLVEQKIKSLTELGSILEISEYEKMGIRNSVEQLFQKNN